MKTKALHNQLVNWRQDLHMNPQIGFEEEYASTARRNKLLYCGMLGAAGFFAVVIFCISQFADVSG